MPEVARDAVYKRVRRDLADLDYKRDLLGLRVLVRNGAVTQREVARWLGITQPSVADAFKRLADVPIPPAGFVGANPGEICQRYAAREITREEVIDQLSRWDYTPADTTDGYDTIVVDRPGTFQEVVDAADRGLIEDEVYDAVVARLAHSADASAPASLG